MRLLRDDSWVRGCMGACVRACMHVRTYVCMCMYVYMCVCMYVCIYVCMYVCVYTFLGQVLIHMIHLLHTHEKIGHIFGTNLGKYTNTFVT